LRHRDAHRAGQDLRQLLGVRHQLDVVAALLEQALGMGRLEIVDADLAAGDMRGDRQHRHATALAVEQPVDQVQIARPAAARAYRELAGQMRLGAGGKRRAFLVPDVNPVDLAGAAQRVGEAVQRIADDAIESAR
jgi:hypothetical protein